MMDTAGIKTLTLTVFTIMIIVGMVPRYLGALTACVFVVDAILRRYCSHNSGANLNFKNIAISLSPIWILFSDPCAVIWAYTLSMLQVSELALEENRKKHRLLFISLTAFSWIFVYVSNFLPGGEICRTPFNIQNEFWLILGSILVSFLSLHRQLDSVLKELMGSLQAVKELNSRLEGLNKELKQSLADKDNFILLFSHETRNPLNILIGNLSLLIGETENTQQKAKLERCKFCADLLLQNLNNVLDSGKLANKGSLELSPTPLNTNEYVHSISNFMEVLIKKKETLKSKLIVPESLPKTLKFDMQRFNQVCLNLLTNALKFTDSGSITLTVRYLRKEVLNESDYYPSNDFGYKLLHSIYPEESLEKDLDEQNNSGIGTHVGYKRQFARELGDLTSKKKTFIGVDNPEKGFLKLEITDTGCGIKPEDLKKLFKKFSQVHTDTSQLKIGSGLGLWLTKALCRLMGGDVRAYSVPNVGSCFVAIVQADCLPSPSLSLTPRQASLAPIDTLNSQGSSKKIDIVAPTVIASSKPKNFDETHRSSNSILCIDNDIYYLDFMREVLTELGATVLTASSGNEGLTLMKNAITEENIDKIPKLVFMNCRMPRMDGWTASKRMKELLRNHFDLSIPIIGVSGDDVDNDQNKFKYSEMEEIIKKPIEKEELKALLTKYF